MSIHFTCLLRHKFAKLCHFRSLTYSTLVDSRKRGSCETGTEDEVNIYPSLESLCLSLLQSDSNISPWQNKCESRYTGSKQADACYHGNSVSKYSSPSTRNSDLFDSLSKIVIPVNCSDLIHIKGASTKSISEEIQRLNIHVCDNRIGEHPSQRNTLGRDSEFLINTSGMQFSSESDSRPAGGMVDNCTGGDGDSRINDDGDGPKQVHLEYVKEYYLKLFPKIHKHGESAQSGILHNDVVFENNFFKKRKITRGINQYITQIHKYRMIASFMYTACFFEPVSITTHINQGCVKLHWRAYVCSNLRFLTHFLPAAARGKSRKEAYDTMEGISTFYVNKDGKVIKHQVDRTMTLDNTETVTTTEKIAAKIPEMIGLAPK